jgi:hypothetical protein
LIVSGVPGLENDRSPTHIYAMGQTQFTVPPDPIATFTVEVREPNGTVRRIDGFPNEDRANLWIRDHR